MHTEESKFLNFVMEYLIEIETQFKNLSGAQMGLNHEKIWRSKILRHTPFKAKNRYGSAKNPRSIQIRIQNTGFNYGIV